MAIDAKKKPILCKHPSFKEEGNPKVDGWKWVCEECGLRFLNLPSREKKRKRDA